MLNDGIQLDLQNKIFSGVNSPAAVSSPSCEVKNELVFPSLPPAQAQSQPQQQQQQQQQHQQSHQEPAKVTPKISQLSELDQQLSKLHNQRPVLSQPQGQQSMTQTYSEAVRQSPTTVQQQFAQPNTTQQLQAPLQQVGQQMPLNLVQNIQASNQVLTPVALQSQPVGDPARKLSRFVISKVNEESKAQQLQQLQQTQQQLNQNQPLQQQINQVQPQSIPKSVNSLEIDQMQMQQQQNAVQSPINVQPIPASQGNKAQMFFQQHHGGVVSRHLNLITLSRCLFTGTQK